MSINPFKNQRGNATMIVIGVVVVAVIGVAIWYAVSHHNKSVATTPAAKATQSACMKLYNDNTICNFAVTAADFNTTSYTATATTSANGTSSALTIKNDGKGNTEVTYESEWSDHQRGYLEWEHLCARARRQLDQYPVFE